MELNKDKKDKKGKWTKEQEELLAEWSEKAAGYRWLHTRSEKLYRKRNYSFTIPVIILSTLTGTANFAMDSFVPEENKQLAMACVGGVNIFAGILSTLQNFLRYAELMEGHRVAEVSWSKFSREISVELALEPSMRKPAFDFLNVCRAEYDRLIEQSPSIDDSIINQYNNKFKDQKHINHPHVCNGLHKCKIYEPSIEEKVSNIVADAGNKLKNKVWKHHNVDLNHNKIERELKPVINEMTEMKESKSLSQTEESKKELEGLMNIGSVSRFKQQVKDIENNIKIEGHHSPHDRINMLLDNVNKITDVNKITEERIIPKEKEDEKEINYDIENPKEICEKCGKCDNEESNKETETEKETDNNGETDKEKEENNEISLFLDGINEK
jgi:hypothetical protein